MKKQGAPLSNHIPLNSEPVLEMTVTIRLNPNTLSPEDIEITIGASLLWSGQQLLGQAG